MVRKEAQIAAKKAEKLVQMNALAFVEQTKPIAANAGNTPDEFFEFNLVEYLVTICAVVMQLY